jgi:hypothetical protein
MREKNLRNRGVSLLLVIAIIAATIIVPSSFKSATAATGSKIKLYNFIKLVVQATGVEVDTTYLEAALKAGIVKEGDFTDYSKYTTRTDAAVILNRADEYLEGDKVDAELLALILSSRISDIKKIESDKREAVAKIYAKGFIKGYSNGYYIKSREFRGSEYMTTSGAKGVVMMLKDTRKRAKLSPDGQLIRMTNLPKNASKYEYILETYPNSFYEMKFQYQDVKYYYKPKELIDYASPARFKNISFHGGNMQNVLDKYKDTWLERVETDLTYRLNVDYRTIDNKWINTLRSVYTQHGDAYSDKRITDDIKDYVKVVKKNKIIIQSKVISVEPSTLYKMGCYYVRAYVKFRITYAGTKLVADDLIGGDYVYMPQLKKDTWYEGVYDIELGTINGSSDGSDYYVTSDSLNDYFYKGE